MASLFWSMVGAILTVKLLLCIEGGWAWEQSSCECRGIQLRRKQVTVYFHDNINRTDFMVARSPFISAGDATTSTGSFGTLLFVNNLVTEGPDPASPALGNFTASFFVSSLPYGSDSVTSAILAFSPPSPPSNPQLQGLGPGTLALSGAIDVFKPQPQPVLGGTGSFALVLGSFTLTNVTSVSLHSQVFRLNLDLYWPPYCPTSFQRY